MEDIRRSLEIDVAQELGPAAQLQALGLPPRFGVGATYKCPAEFVLRHGTSYGPSELTSDEMAYVSDCIKRTPRRFPMGNCYVNSQWLLFEGDSEHRLSYVEGYCAWARQPESPAWAAPHGWLVVGTKVVDVTWRVSKPRRSGPLRNRVLGTWSPGEFDYFGVRMDTDYVLNRCLDRENYGTMIDDFQGGWPLLHGEQRWVPAR